MTDRSPDAWQRELVRLDLMHIVMLKTVGDEPYLAPIDEDTVQRVLDIGTGTGICGFRSLVVREQSRDEC